MLKKILNPEYDKTKKDSILGAFYGKISLEQKFQSLINLYNNTDKGFAIQKRTIEEEINNEIAKLTKDDLEPIKGIIEKELPDENKNRFLKKIQGRSNEIFSVKIVQYDIEEKNDTNLTPEAMPNLASQIVNNLQTIAQSIRSLSENAIIKDTDFSDILIKVNSYLEKAKNINSNTIQAFSQLAPFIKENVSNVIELLDLAYDDQLMPQNIVELRSTLLKTEEMIQDEIKQLLIQQPKKDETKKDETKKEQYNSTSMQKVFPEEDDDDDNDVQYTIEIP
ncbi:MAG: hypothetical protein ACD_20C00027G0001, partial [uncultured bacterium]